jgi:epoxyqueuosine reductase
MTSEDLKARAIELGFDVCGVAPAASFPELQYFRDWLAEGYAGNMLYLHKSADVRADVRHLLPSARSVIVTGTLYNTDGPHAAREQAIAARERPADAVRVARYARGDDYHVVLAERLEALVAWMREQHAEPFEASIFVDKHHVQERVYARRAGVGWVGKNTCIINPEIGSWLLLAGVAVSLDLAADAPSLDQCGECTLCLDSCPTGALVEAHVLDATKCISYLTIELKGDVPIERRPQLHDHLYGCDICQEVCPWNLAPPTTADPAWQPRLRDGLRAADLWQKSDQELHAVVDGSAMLHTSLSRLRRNLALIIGNSGDQALRGVLDRPGGGVRNAAPSATAPVVQTAVQWALARLDEDGPADVPTDRSYDGT